METCLRASIDGHNYLWITDGRDCNIAVMFTCLYDATASIEPNNANRREETYWKNSPAVIEPMSPQE